MRGWQGEEVSGTLGFQGFCFVVYFVLIFGFQFYGTILPIWSCILLISSSLCSLPFPQIALATKDSRNRKPHTSLPLIIKIPDDYDFWEYL